MKANPEVGIQFGASGAALLEAAGTIDPAWAIRHGRRMFVRIGRTFLAGAVLPLSPCRNLWMIRHLCQVSKMGHLKS